MTGEFGEKGLVEDISDLTPQQMLDVWEWQQFYQTSYTHIGNQSKKLPSIGERRGKWAQGRLFQECSKTFEMKSEWRRETLVGDTRRAFAR